MRVTAALTSAGIGYNAVVAEIVASAHDGYESAYMVSADTFRDDVAVGLGGGEFHIHRLVSGLHLGHQVGKRKVGIGTTYHINVMVLRKVLFGSLGHTAHNADEKPFFLLFHGVQRLQAVPYLLFGVLADGAGVQEYGIGLVNAVGGLIACHTHNRCNDLTVGYIHLAAVGFYEQFLCPLFHFLLVLGHKNTHFP